MEKQKPKNPAAVALGSIRTEKKAKASKENGKRGGYSSGVRAAVAAIDRSISHTEIVHIDDEPGVRAALAERCEDFVDTNEGVIEYWGTERGEEWRVHVEINQERAGK